MDVSIFPRGPLEDKAFSLSSTLSINVRRGNSLLIDENSKKILIARKGLMKFFDIKLEWLDPKLRYGG